MTQEIWALVRRDGTVAWQGFRDASDLEIAPEPGTVLIAVDRLVDPWERIDQVTGQVSEDVAARLTAIDAAHRADHGDDAIARGRTVKLVEAMVIATTGQRIEGVLSAEAALRGIGIDDMVQIVLGAAATDRDIEIKRMQAKLEASRDHAA